MGLLLVLFQVHLIVRYEEISDWTGKACNKLVWKSDCQCSFDVLNMLSSDPVIVLPDFSRPCVLTTDTLFIIGAAFCISSQMWMTACILVCTQAENLSESFVIVT